MTPVRRDAILAAASGAALLAVLAVTESLSLLARPASAAAGIGAALIVEGLFVADTPAVDLWERRPVRLASAGALVGGGAVAVALGGAWFVAVVCWGLATYFLLLALLASGIWRPAGS